MGAIKTLSEVFQETPQENNAFRAKVIQAMSATVRSHELAEAVFCGVDQSRHLIWEGLHGAEVLQKRTLFLLRALITSDAATRERVRLFAHSVAYVADHFALATECSHELREIALALLEQILEQKKSVNTVLDRKDALVAQGVQRVAALRALTGEEREFASVELEHWENLLVQLSRASPDGPEEPTSSTPPAMLEAPEPEMTPQ
jgi:bacterioferritin-associated ferredoxin